MAGCSRGLATAGGMAGARSRPIWARAPGPRRGWFETGLLQPEDWVARWVEPAEDVAVSSADLLTHDFELDAPVTNGRLYATAHGIYECFLNGRRVGDLELTPGFTSYSQRLHVQTYDVTRLLVQGRNRWEVVLTDGWYRGRTGGGRRREGYGSTLGFLGQLEAADVIVATGPEWECAVGPVVSADLIAGQVEDHRRALTRRRPVVLPDSDLGPLAWSPAPPVRRVQELRPVSVVRSEEAHQTVDLGQNINGWLRLRDLGPAGTELTVLHGEALDPSGHVTQENLMMSDTHHDVADGPFQVDRVLSAGRAGDVFEPRHTTHGFRYARIEGHPGRITPDDVTGVVVHTDLRRTGWFRCSDDSLIASTTSPNGASATTRATSRPTARSVSDRVGRATGSSSCLPRRSSTTSSGSRSSGSGTSPPTSCRTAPSPISLPIPCGDSRLPRAISGRCSRDPPDGATRSLSCRGSCGGPTATSTSCPSCGRRWCDGSTSRLRRRGPVGTLAARPIGPNPCHTRSSSGTAVSTGVSGTSPESRTSWRLSRPTKARWGPPTSTGPPRWRPASVSFSEDRASRAVLGAGSERVARLAERYIDDEGRLRPDSQANHVRALAFGLVPTELRELTADRLVGLMAEAGGHLGTGFLATPFLLPVLAETGHLDVAYELLLQRTPPSWLTMVDRGATTVWENWDGIDAAVWPATPQPLQQRSGRLVPAQPRRRDPARDGQPGYRRFRVAPAPGGGLTWAQAIHDSAYGPIESSGGPPAALRADGHGAGGHRGRGRPSRRAHRTQGPGRRSTQGGFENTISP